MATGEKLLRLTYDAAGVPEGGSAVLGSFAAPVADCGSKEIAGHSYHRKQLIRAGLLVEGARSLLLSGGKAVNFARASAHSSFPPTQSPNKTGRSRSPLQTATLERALGSAFTTRARGSSWDRLFVAPVRLYARAGRR